MSDEEIAACAFCGSNELLAMDDEGRHYMMCLECHACGPLETSAVEAYEAWCERPEVEPVDYLATRRIILLS